MGVAALTRELGKARRLVGAGPVRLWATPAAGRLLVCSHPLGLVAVILHALNGAGCGVGDSPGPVSMPLDGQPGVRFAGARLDPSEPYLLVLHAAEGEQVGWPRLVREAFDEAYPPHPRPGPRPSPRGRRAGPGAVLLASGGGARDARTKAVRPDGRAKRARVSRPARAIVVAIAAFLALWAWAALRAWLTPPRSLDRLPEAPAPVLAPEGGPAEGMPH